jgi:hypothetical protein
MNQKEWEILFTSNTLLKLHHLCILHLHLQIKMWNCFPLVHSAICTLQLVYKYELKVLQQWRFIWYCAGGVIAQKTTISTVHKSLPTQIFIVMCLTSQVSMLYGFYARNPLNVTCWRLFYQAFFSCNVWIDRIPLQDSTNEYLVEQTLSKDIRYLQNNPNTSNWYWWMCSFSGIWRWSMAHFLTLLWLDIS